MNKKTNDDEKNFFVYSCDLASNKEIIALSSVNSTGFLHKFIK